MRPSFQEPMLPTLVEVAPDGDDWIHEIKYDGYRSQLVVENRKVKAFTRRGADWTEKYGSIAIAAAKLPVKSAILDGEMVVLDATGKSNFHSFRRAIKGSPGRLLFMAFDVLLLDGKDMRAQTTLARHLALSKLVAGASSAIQFSDSIQGGGKAFYDAADALGLAGIVSKRANAPYVSGRSRSWLKTKSYLISELEVAGVLEGRGKPTVALMVDSDNNYRGGAFITNRGIKERCWPAFGRRRGRCPKAWQRSRTLSGFSPASWQPSDTCAASKTCGMPAFRR